MEQSEFSYANPKEDNPEQEWTDMPEFVQWNTSAIKRVIISFESENDIEEFNKRTGLKISMKTRGVFFPERPPRKIDYVDEP